MPYGIELAQASGAQAAGQFVNEGMGLLFAGPKRKAQMKTAKGLQDLEIAGQKQMTDYNMQKQLEMWEKTGYGAQVDQMKKAGINPALLYGMGSGAGQTANVATGNVTGQQAHEPQPSRGGEGMGLMIGQMGLIEAQRKNIEADTRLKEVDANKKEGADTENVRAQTRSITQGIENQKAQENLTRVQTELAQVTASVARQTMTEAIEIIENQVKKSAAEIKEIGLRNQLSEAQMKDKIELLKAETAGQWAANELTKEDTNLKGAQQAKIAAEITTMLIDQQQEWIKMSYEERKTAMYEKLIKFNTSQGQRNYENILKGVDRVLNAVKPGAGVIPEPTPGNTPVRGFHDRSY